MSTTRRFDDFERRELEQIIAALALRETQLRQHVGPLGRSDVWTNARLLREARNEMERRDDEIDRLDRMRERI